MKVGSDMLGDADNESGGQNDVDKANGLGDDESGHDYVVDDADVIGRPCVVDSGDADDGDAAGDGDDGSGRQSVVESRHADAAIRHHCFVYPCYYVYECPRHSFVYAGFDSDSHHTNDLSLLQCVCLLVAVSSSRFSISLSTRFHLLKTAFMHHLPAPFPELLTHPTLCLRPSFPLFCIPSIPLLPLRPISFSPLCCSIRRSPFIITSSLSPVVFFLVVLASRQLVRHVSHPSLCPPIRFN